MIASELYRAMMDTDLRTAEDVLRWLRVAPAADPEGKDYSACARIADRLSSVLDHERRKACRRAALMAWRDFRRDVCAGDMKTAFDDEPEWVAGHCAKYLALALYFRAEARRP